MKLLLVEDDRDLMRSMLFYFHGMGYTTEKAGSVQDALGNYCYTRTIVLS
jgi:CheY-like chemotaxis protein